MSSKTTTIQEIEVMAANLNSLLECLAAVDYNKVTDEGNLLAAARVASEYSWKLWAAIFELNK